MFYLNSSRSFSPDLTTRTDSGITFDNKFFELQKKLKKIGKHQLIAPNSNIGLQFEGYDIKLFEVPLL